ncbi:hypothetical protein OQI_13855 [Streptomyces pharetrae CZA14]|uniref:Pentapeptide repeat-containing protein n=1 Tax=Streptomyces pharetrae CZA14 TaxID=1144883 RepID=A0ABX3YJQ3_9ACTN|nr:hypothetical protein OQI_13855 [Streptomyces pharetrae CZA14]
MSVAARQSAVSAPADLWTRIQQAAGTLAALGTLAVIVFTWQSIRQVDNEHALTREGQVTDRYNAAVTNIGEDSLEVRLGGIYALQRIMEDSPRDQPSIVDVLSTYIRNHAKKPKRATDTSNGEPASDIQAALTALGSRDPAHDGTARVDLRGTNLIGANLIRANLRIADLRDADLRGAYLYGADLRGTDLRDVDLRAYLSDVDLSGALLRGADLRGTNLHGADLSDAYLSGTNLLGTNLHDVDLRGADLSDADLRGADLSGADLRRVDLRGVDLRGADLRGADLRGVDLRGANLHGTMGP